MNRWPKQLGVDMLAALLFLSRLPLPHVSAVATSDLGRSLRFAPIAGAAIAGGPSAATGIGTALDLPITVTATLAVAASVLITGALHEDGLADVADGFGGGWTAERTLEIMRDSRIGTFGALALGLGLGLRVACLASLLDRRGAVATVAVLVATAALSRSMMLIPLTLLRPARPDGLAHGAGRMTVATLITALVLGLAIVAATLLPAGFRPAQVLASIGAGGAAGVLSAAIAHRTIRGVTGDVLGATQQLSEIAILIVLSATHAVM